MRSYLMRYSIATIAVAIAFLLTQLIWWLIQPHLYPLFLAAVMVSSWYGGIGPGLFATALAAILCNYFFVHPLYSMVITWDGVVGVIQFVLVATLISTLNTMLRSTQHQAERNAREAQRNYEYLRQSQESLHQSEERYRLFVEGVTNYAIFLLDTDGKITSWNAGAERILGFQEIEIVGQSFQRIFTSEAIEQGIPNRALRDAATQGMSRDDRWHLRKDGTRFWANGVVIPLRGESGNLRGFAKILQDLTERRLAEEEREELLHREQAARAEAEAANHSKDEFLAIVSHELRTPMTAIVGWAGMLRSGMLDEERAELAMETIERNANSQMQLIEDLLDISRIIRGDISLNFTSVNLPEAIASAIKVVQPAANNKAIDCRFSIADFGLGASDRTSDVESNEQPNNPKSKTQNPKFLVWGDSDRLQQVVLNLLSNAIKFTPEGGQVTVHLSTVIRSSNRQPTTNNQLPITRSAQIQVSDTGIGISPDFLPHIFERFRQADSTSARSSKGLGLGLAIARHLIELHGGTIQAESAGVGQGATFTVKLPLVEESRGAKGSEGENFIQNPKPEIQNSPDLSLEGLRVLVVDDEVDTRQWITLVLEECKAQIIAVGSVDEALKTLQQHKPDVLISDIGLPGEDGYALIRKIRELEAETGGRIPAVALTAYARVADYKEALIAGFQLHVAKPIRAAELIAVVASLAEMGKI